jgi:hypothetical protein
MLHTLCFSLQNAVYFIMLPFWFIYYSHFTYRVSQNLNVKLRRQKVNIKFCITYINVHTCTTNGVLYLKFPSICHTSVLVLSCYCRFRFSRLSLNFLSLSLSLSRSVTLTDYRPYIHTSSYSSLTFNSVLFSWFFHLRLIIHAKVAKCLSSVVLLPVRSFLNAISWLTRGHLFIMPSLLHI